MGTLGLSEKKLWRLTLREYLIRADGYHRRQADGLRGHRLVATVIANVNRPEKTRPYQPWDILWLPGDPLPTADTLSPEEFEATMARLQ